MSNHKNIIAIVQARVGSSRLNAKILKTLYDKALLEHIVERIKASRKVNTILIATTLAGSDDIVCELSKKMGVVFFRGSEENVLDRFYNAAKAYHADVIVRCTADDPFKDPEIIDHAIELLLNGQYDYCSNTIEPTYPEGLDIEVFTMSALEKTYHEARLNSEKEHVTPYIWKNPSLFKIYNFKNDADLSALRWTIDYGNDYTFAKEIYKRLYPTKKIFLMNDILNILAKDPEIGKINSNIIRNEGYRKSIEKEELNA